MFMAPKHYKLPLCIYLRCVWPAVSLCSRTVLGLVFLFMNTNYSSISPPLNISLLFPVSPHLLLNLRASRSDSMQGFISFRLSLLTNYNCNAALMGDPLYMFNWKCAINSRRCHRLLCGSPLCLHIN